MRNTLTAITLASALTAAGAASAAEIEGMIVRTDDSTRTVILDNGERYVAAPDIDTSKLEWGEPYTITLETVDGKLIATYFDEIRNGEDAD